MVCFVVGIWLSCWGQHRVSFIFQATDCLCAEPSPTPAIYSCSHSSQRPHRSSTHTTNPPPAQNHTYSSDKSTAHIPNRNISHKAPQSQECIHHKWKSLWRWMINGPELRFYRRERWIWGIWVLCRVNTFKRASVPNSRRRYTSQSRSSPPA